VPLDIGAHIGARIDQRVAHAGLGGEVDDAVGVFLPFQQRREGAALGHVDAGKAKRVAAEARELGEPRLLQRRVVVVVDVVDADDGFAARHQRARHMHADEPGRAGDDDGHCEKFFGDRWVGGRARSKPQNSLRDKRDARRRPRPGRARRGGGHAEKLRSARRSVTWLTFAGRR
jgi:hypothetical protein